MVQGKALLFIFVLGLGGTFQLGNHLTLISSPTMFIKEFINSSWTQRYGGAPGESTAGMIWSAVVASFGLGGLIGAISVQWVTNYLGRKRAMIWNNAINIVASSTMYTSRLANSFEMIMLSRFLFGFTSGLGGSVHVLYLGESSLKELRGMVTLTAAIFLATGKLTGQIMGLSELLGREEFWNILLCVPAFFSVIQMATLPFFPEAPRYLLIEKGDTEQCRKALQFLWGPGEYQKEIEEMLVEQEALRGQRNKTLWHLLKDRSVRWQLLTLVVLNEGIQFCGNPGISMFSFSIFQEAGIPVDKIRYVTLGVGISEMFTNLTCGLLIDRVGRRVMLWAGFGAMATIMVLITTMLLLKDYSFWIPYITVSLIFLFIICYGGGPASVSPPLSHEMFVQSYRSAAFVFNGFIKWANFSIFGFIFSFLLAGLKSFTFLFFSCVCLAASLYFFFILPETKGKTPLEISEDFRNIRVCSSTTNDICLETKL
ncbi:solute carrier family 2, facilitated glucose transporter member 11-like isoform X2 [Electrophorus electricus]|uniref:solute carrier family 2, facilitated glucose transporter member 11-like isoform X2 n=1 Tax=Electrophorus electricus TaxID=8005 RepID=UPI0015D0AAD2|nr:solute carrier family 2, facilitated glucose transporter member 11-like isoform X2 [Electrophorus electricus]